MVAVSGDTFAAKAVDHASSMCGSLTLVTVVKELTEAAFFDPMLPIVGMAARGTKGDPATVIADINKHYQAHADSRLAKLKQRALAAGATNVDVVKLAGEPGEALADYAVTNAAQIEAVFIGARGLGRVKSMVLGSVSQYLIGHVPMDVVVVRKAADNE